MDKLLRGAGENTAPADSIIGRAWINVTRNLASRGGRTASEGGEPESTPYELVTADLGLDPNDAGCYVIAVAENVLETAGLSSDVYPDLYPMLTGAIWGALLTGVEVMVND